MNNYVLMTDSSCDIDRATLQEWGVPSAELWFAFTDEEKEYTGVDMPEKEFYAAMRSGRVAKTSAVNSQTFVLFFEPYLKQGLDILYLGFSSGLSTTLHSAETAAKELTERYPDRTIRVVDTLCASTGQGLLVWLTLKKKNAGASLDEAAEFAENTKLHIDHWFTVSDLIYLKRGGRINALSYFAGTALNVKPVLHVDNEGHLINMFKVRGRKASVKALADKLAELAVNKEGEYFICNGDCPEDVEYLQDLLEKTTGHRANRVEYTGAVIGAHSGPGTLALFFVGRER